MYTKMTEIRTQFCSTYQLFSPKISDFLNFVNLLLFQKERSLVQLFPPCPNEYALPNISSEEGNGFSFRNFGFHAEY